jgi:large subunit ribosomal protein L4
MATEISVIKLSDKSVDSKLELSKTFETVYNPQAVFNAIRVYRTNTRQDSAKTKKRDEVSGSNIKPWKQKGTGRARQGSRRSPQWRGGGVVFGPTGEQNHFIKQNRKEYYLAMASVLTKKYNDGLLKVIDEFKYETFNTNQVVTLLSDLKVTTKTMLVYDETSLNEQALYSARNLQDISLVSIDNINVYHIVNANYVIFTKSALAELEAKVHE